MYRNTQHTPQYTVQTYSAIHHPTYCNTHRNTQHKHTAQNTAQYTAIHSAKHSTNIQRNTAPNVPQYTTQYTVQTYSAIHRPIYRNTQPNTSAQTYRAIHRPMYCNTQHTTQYTVQTYSAKHSAIRTCSPDATYANAAQPQSMGDHHRTQMENAVVNSYLLKVFTCLHTAGENECTAIRKTRRCRATTTTVHRWTMRQKMHTCSKYSLVCTRQGYMNALQYAKYADAGQLPPQYTDGQCGR
jgi:hypothetical protein